MSSENSKQTISNQQSSTEGLSTVADRSFLVMQKKEPIIFSDGFLQEAEEIKEQILLKQISFALETSQIIFYLQPVFNTKKLKFISAEALARWQHPEQGLISPDIFIPPFERHSRIHEIDLYILDAVCSFQHSLLKEGIRPLPISVNLSQLDFYDQALSDKILFIVEKYGVPHFLICFEITESTYMDNQKQLLATLQSLKNLGFSILLDDFGSGYSSLDILSKAPIDILKIDKDFIQMIGCSKKGERALQTIVNLSIDLKIDVIAEGVETKEQSNFLAAIGCTHIQGYFYAKPMPIKAYKEILQASR
ncbi:EAL domain-containing protein [uncultured Sphaerochaeta sp.]|uniref:EAL domain-containing protein n=1 Tax=uncultured Sphaerochaeta sp. TaxID=886478 RepID=UPI002A0A5D96|nr:EAL domain-containing protein [uncultured Sphaerochaeta sp.]